jgi:site-specific DNA-methyltransferase (adenine-specific)
MYKIYNEDCLIGLKKLENESVDMVLTSPPYDNLRNYGGVVNNWNFDFFKQVADELYRVVKTGGVVVWVVGDATIKGSETGTSFKQALYFKEIGFNIHDTMIYRKLNYTPLTHNRYEQEFEYMFCFSKGKPKTFNPIKIPCKWAGTETWGESSYYKTDDGTLIKKPKTIISDTKIKGNIFEYHTGSTTVSGKIKHPAMFPLQLAIDQIQSWSNENDVILDPFIGSGTTALACKELHRDCIGFELNEEYYNITLDRLSSGD